MVKLEAMPTKIEKVSPRNFIATEKEDGMSVATESEPPNLTNWSVPRFLEGMEGWLIGWLRFKLSLA